MKKSIIFSMLCFAITVLFGCSQKSAGVGDHSASFIEVNETDQTEMELAKKEEMGNSVEEKSEVKVAAGWESIPESIQDTSCETIGFEAQVTVPQVLRSGYGKSWSCEKIIFDETVTEIFGINQEDVIEENELELDDNLLGKYIYKGITTEDGSMLSYGGHYLDYVTQEYFYITNCIDRDIRVSEYNLDRYAMDTDLDFMPYREAGEKMIAFMEKLGLTVSDQYVCYALDCDTLASQEDCTDEMGQWVKEQEKGEWTQEDECYLFLFHQEVEGITVSQAGYGNIMNGSGNADSDIEIIYGQQGIVYLRINHVYTIQEELTSMELLTADAVRDILIDAQNLIIGGNEIKVLHMEPVLLPIVVNEKKMELTPVWEIEERINYVELGVQDYRTVHFDGSTGQEII